MHNYDIITGGPIPYTYWSPEQLQTWKNVKHSGLRNEYNYVLKSYYDSLGCFDYSKAFPVDLVKTLFKCYDSCLEVAKGAYHAPYVNADKDDLFDWKGTPTTFERFPFMVTTIASEIRQFGGMWQPILAYQNMYCQGRMGGYAVYGGRHRIQALYSIQNQGIEATVSHLCFVTDIRNTFAGDISIPIVLYDTFISNLKLPVLNQCEDYVTVFVENHIDLKIIMKILEKEIDSIVENRLVDLFHSGFKPSSVINQKI